MNAEIEGHEAATAFRSRHGLGTQPLGDLVAIIERFHGADVAILDASPDVHGMTMRDPVRGAVMVAVARTRHPMRQRSTLAHELAHLVFGDWAPPKTSGWDERGREEIRADAFARHLLVPIEGLRAVLAEQTRLTAADLSALVQHFRASPAIVAIQLRDIGYIDADMARSWSALTTPSLAARYGWSDQYRALREDSHTRRAPQRLLARATEGYIANSVSLHVIARLRGVPAEDVQAEFAQAGIFPVSQDTIWASPEDLPARRRH